MIGSGLDPKYSGIFQATLQGCIELSGLNDSIVCPRAAIPGLSLVAMTGLSFYMEAIFPVYILSMKRDIPTFW